MQFRKLISVLLAALLAALCLVPAFAAEATAAVPVARKVAEYANADAAGLLVTFSDKTRADAFAGDVALPADGALTAEDLRSGLAAGSYFAVYDDAGELFGIYDGDALAGQTLTLPGGGFTVYVVSAANETLPFGIDTVVPLEPEGRFTVTYHLSLEGLRDITRSYDPANGPACFSGVGLGNTSYRKLALAGWAAEENGAPVLDPGAPFPEGQGDTELWAVWVPVLLGKEETYSFNNYAGYFVNDERGEKYYMSKEDYRRMQMNVLLSLSAAGQPAAVYAAVMAYDANKEWGGSCYGLALTAALQHLGVIDMLALQEGASCVNELQPDDKLISFINYYHILQKTDWFVENKAHTAAPAMYKTLLKDLCDTLRAGNIVLFSYYPGSMYIKDGHTVLLAGIYDDTAGNHVLIAYNPNDPWEFADGNYQSLYTVSADYSSVTCNNGDAVCDVKWTADFDQYRSFDYTGKKDFISWARIFFMHVRGILQAFFRSFGSVC